MPPGSKGDEPLPASTATRSAGRRLRPASLQESEMSFFSSPRDAQSRNFAGQEYASDLMTVFFGSLLDARAPKL
jgi:hypothetical protein